jgi:hypothetical protein
MGLFLLSVSSTFVFGALRYLSTKTLKFYMAMLLGCVFSIGGFALIFHSVGDLSKVLQQIW